MAHRDRSNPVTPPDANALAWRAIGAVGYALEATDLTDKQRLTLIRTAMDTMRADLRPDTVDA